MRQPSVGWDRVPRADGEITAHTRILGLASAGALAAALSACGTDTVPENADLIEGKKAFVKSCGSCHVLNRAGSKGNFGPNLDAAFRQSLADGFGRDTIRGVVLNQINHPARVPKDSPAFMPAKLVDDKLAYDVAAYVASVASLSGKDTGRLATAVPLAGAGKPVAAKGGKLDDAGRSQRPARLHSTKADSPGRAAGDRLQERVLDAARHRDRGRRRQREGRDRPKRRHLEGLRDRQGRDYTYYCSLPGHREGGMLGKLTVK